MFATLIVTFREVLEIALIAGVVLTYLYKTQQMRFARHVYFGLGAGVVGALIVALGFERTLGFLSGRGEQIFEGVMMLLGAGLLTTMVIWMQRQKNAHVALQTKTQARIDAAEEWSLFLFIFISVLREGVELVIYLTALQFAAVAQGIFGVILGATAAGVLAYGIFLGSKKINLKKFFTATTVLLLFFAAGLVTQGVHEFEEADIIPATTWNISSNTKATEASSEEVEEAEEFGTHLLQGLFGVSSDMTPAQAAAWFAALGVGFYCLREKKPLN